LKSHSKRSNLRFIEEFSEGKRLGVNPKRYQILEKKLIIPKNSY